MGIGFKIFLYGFLGMVASILIYNLVKLFRGLKLVECHAEKLLPQQVETKTGDSGLIKKISAEVKNENLRKPLLKEIDQPGKEKPKGFWKRLVDNMKAYRDEDDDFLERDHHRDDFHRMLRTGIIPSGIYTHENFKGDKG